MLFLVSFHIKKNVEREKNKNTVMTSESALVVVKSCWRVMCWRGYENEYVSSRSTVFKLPTMRSFTVRAASQSLWMNPPPVSPRLLPASKRHHQMNIYIQAELLLWLFKQLCLIGYHSMSGFIHSSGQWHWHFEVSFPPLCLYLQRLYLCLHVCAFSHFLSCGNKILVVSNIRLKSNICSRVCSSSCH